MARTAPTISSTLARIKALSPILTARWLTDEREFRVSISIYAISARNPTWKEPACAKKNEAIAYYSSDHEDTLLTAAAILAHWELNPKPKRKPVAKRSVEAIFANKGRFL